MGLKEKISYLYRSIINQAQPKECPYCGKNEFKVIDRKYFFTSLLYCKNCELNHRHPKDDKIWLEKFYQSDYNIEDPYITDLPGDKDLQKLKQENFPQLPDYSPYLDLLSQKERQTVKILDFGCSWGYQIYKFKNDGFQAEGFELSVPRASFGEKKLGVKIYTSLSEVPAGYDIIFSSHVIEHLRDIKEFISFSRSVLKEDGLMVIFCPNGSKEFQKRDPKDFHVNWGFLHPNYLSHHFAYHLFHENPHLILTGDWNYNEEDLKNWNGKSQVKGEKKDGKELLIISKPNMEL